MNNPNRPADHVVEAVAVGAVVAALPYGAARQHLRSSLAQLRKPRQPKPEA